MESPSGDSDDPEKQKTFKKNKSNRSGVDYEMGLIMLFLKRSEENHYKFELATEFSECEKFDDLYFKDYSTEKRVYLLQAKHKDNVLKKISFDDLNSQSDTDFSLLKYFNTYRKIKENPEFQQDLDSMNFILCTTIYLDSISKHLKNSKSMEVIEVKESDGIFKTDKQEVGKRYRLKINDEEERERIFRNSYSDLKAMTNRLVECVLEGKNINVEQIPSVRLYHVALAEHVIDVKNQCFRSKFLNDPENLSRNAKVFRRTFYNSIHEYLNVKKNSLQRVHTKERKKIQVILKEFHITPNGAKNEVDIDFLNEILKSKKLKLVGNFGRLHIKNLQEFIQELCDVLNGPRQSALQVTKSTSFGKSLAQLGGYVMFIENGVMKFSEEFLMNEELPNSFREFRNLFKATIGVERFSELGQCKWNFTFKTQNDLNPYKDKLYWDLEDSSTSSEVMDFEINQFLEKLIFIVTPKCNDIRKVIENEMKGEFGPKGENIFGSLNAKLVDWMNYRDDKGHGYYLSNRNNVYTESKKQCLGSTRFRVKKIVEFFTGRESQIDEIGSRIREGAVVIYGLNGVGKTELALKYIHKTCTEEDNVIWIDAESRKSATQSFHTLYKQLGFKIEDEHEEHKSMKVITEGLYGYLADTKTLFVFDNAENLSAIEEFLPTSVANTIHILITSPNSLEWKSSRHRIRPLPLNDFTDPEAVNYVKRALLDAEQNPQDIINLIKKLHNFPMALDQAVRYIKDKNREHQDRGWKFGIRDYLEKYEQTPKTLLNVELPPDAHVQGTFRTLSLTFERIISNEKYGQQALTMINIMSYFSKSNIPEKTFLIELADNDYEKLIPVTQLLTKYSAVRLDKGMMHIHGLVQEVRKLELEEANEEEVLQMALKLLKRHLATRDDIAAYASHIISVWKHAGKYDTLISDFIVNDILDSLGLLETEDEPNNVTEENTETTDDFSSCSEFASSRNIPRATSYFHVLAGGSGYEDFFMILDKIKNRLGGPKILHKFINIRGEDKKTFLHYAAEGGNDRIVKILIEYKANVETRDRIDSRPLHLAARHGHLGVVTTLIDKKASINVKTSPQFAYTPLHFAAQNGHLDIVGVLLDKNAEINCKTTMGFTPLHLASQKGYVDIVESLLNKKADVNIETSKKYTALHFAAKNDYLPIVDLLLKRDANVNALDNNKFTPLHWAALNGSEMMVNYLLQNPYVNVKIESTEGKTALHLAEEKGHSKVISALTAKINKL